MGCDSGQQDNRNVTVFFIPFQIRTHFIPVLFRHHNIKDNGVRRICMHLLQPLNTVVCDFNLKAFLFQVSLNNGSEIRFIINYKNSLFFAHDILPLFNFLIYLSLILYLMCLHRLGCQVHGSKFKVSD